MRLSRETITREVLDKYHDAVKPERFELLAAACGPKPYKEIALEMGIPVGTLKSRINRARNKVAFAKHQAETMG